MKVHERGHETRGETRESLKTSKEENTEKEERRKTVFKIRKTLKNCIVFNLQLNDPQNTLASMTLIFFQMLLTNEKKLGVQMKHRDLNKCSECPSVFQTKSALDSHLSQDHPEYKGFLCSTCGKGFRRQKGGLTKEKMFRIGHYFPFSMSHLPIFPSSGLSHHNTYICPKPSARCHPCLDPSCSAKFNSPRDLRRHAKNKHSPSGARTQGAENERQRHWKCPDCPTVCSSGKSLRVHGRTAHPGTDGVGSLSFQCLQCPEGKMFLKQSYLEVR